MRLCHSVECLKRAFCAVAKRVAKPKSSIREQQQFQRDNIRKDRHKETNMSDRNEFSAGLGAKICGAWADAGGTPAQLNRLSQSPEVIKGVVEILLGRAIIGAAIIDCDADPFVPDGLTVLEHRKGGQLVWDITRVKSDPYPYLTYGDQVGAKNVFLKSLENKSMMNANVLDYLLRNQHLIPDDWKGKLVCFYRTVYRPSNGGSQRVRYLAWNGRTFTSGHHQVDNDNWFRGSLAARLAS